MPRAPAPPRIGIAPAGSDAPDETGRSAADPWPRATPEPRAAPTESVESVTAGERVRVLSGPFAGKVGTVQAVDGRDGKGGVRVMLGLVTVKFDAKDVAPCVEATSRPRLATSHRSPRPARS